jgi:putative chitinase
MDVSAIQRRCLVLGYSPGPVDGELGPRTYAAIFSAVARRKLANALEFGKGAARHFPRYEITTGLRLCHWLGQIAHESGGFFYLRELGGPDYFFRMYDPFGKRPQVAARLGNTQPGDGARYCGRGLIQLTGRANYRAAGRRLGLPLEDEPDLAAEPANAVLIACDYWGSRKINRQADRDDLEGVTMAINGGANGLDDRRKYTGRAKAILL